MNLDDIKKELRKKVLLERKTIENKRILDQEIRKKVLQNKKIKNSRDILVYISKEGEVDTFLMIEELLKLKKNIYAPRIENKEILFYKIESLKELKLGKFNIFEPSSSLLFKEKGNTCILVPGLLFDKEGCRLGYGGGYYDRFLSKINIYKIGICYSKFLVGKLKTEEHDIKMDEVLTER